MNRSFCILLYKQVALICLLLVLTQISHAAKSTFNVKDYGAKGDGSSLNTKSIQSAIDACSKSGGGTVLLPAGKYVSGTIYLKSHVTLFLEAGAILEGSKNLKDYPVTISKVRSFTDNYTNKSLIYAEDLEDVTVSGNGMIDGNGASFKVGDMPGDVSISKEEYSFYKSRPYIIRMINCRKILIRDITLVNSPMWVQHYLLCENLNIDGITVNSKVNHNNDGIDIDGCDRVRISNCDIRSGDDAIVLKSTLDKPCRNITITNCILNSDCNAFKLGTESNGGFENITFSNSVIYDTPLSGVTLQLVDGGTLDRVSVTNITMNNVGAAIFIRLGNRARPYNKKTARPGVGTLAHVIIDKIMATNISSTGCSITGLPESMADFITLTNLCFSFEGGGTQEDARRIIPELPDAYPEHTMFGKLPAYGFYIRHCKNLRFENIDIDYIKAEKRPAFIFDNTENLQLTGIKARTDIDAPVIQFSCVKNATIHSSKTDEETGTFLNLAGTENLHLTMSENDLSYCRIPVTGANKSAVFLDSNRMPPLYGLSDGPYVNCGLQYTDDREIKISSPAGIKAKRREIVRAIWGTDRLPDRSDVMVTPGIKSPLNPNPAVSRVDRYEIPVNASVAQGAEFVSDLAYLFVPVKRNNRLVLLNPGHSCTLKDDPETNFRVEETIIGLLQAGFDVLAVFMPHVSETNCDIDHCKIMNTGLNSNGQQATYGLRFFLEPEIVSLNYLMLNNQYRDINMVGLSGGGWTTNILAAIDERIKYSFSVAGSMPIYYRSDLSMGDIEQYLPELYRDIAGYPDLYVLGAYGQGRKQVQILNRNDNCCFGQKQHDPDRNYENDLRTFEKSVKEKLTALGAEGRYYLVIDETAPKHQISAFTLNEVILKELKTTK